MGVLLILLLATTTLALNPASPVNYLGCGLDAYKATYGQAPIFRFTYDDGQTIRSPYSHIDFDVPDEMFIHPMQKMEEVIMQGTYSTYDKYLDMYTEWFNFGVSIDVDYFAAGFNYNRQLGSVHQRMQEHFSDVMHGHHYWSYYIASLYPAKTLNMTTEFNMALDSFPVPIVTQEDHDYAYQFVQTFGTHYMYKAVFGAKVDFNTAITQDLKKSYSFDWISEQFGFSFRYTLFNISIDTGYNHSEIHVSKEFLRQSSAETFFVGGDPTVANLDHLDIWAKTLDQNTFPLNITLMGIWTLTSDKKKQDTIKQYVIDYLSGRVSQKRSLHQNLDTSCLGAGMNILTLDGCLASIYQPTDNDLFVTSRPESQWDQFSVLMQEQYSIDAWSRYHSSSSSFFGLGSKTKDTYRFYQQHYQESKSLSKNLLELAYYRITAPAFPMPALSASFSQALNTLPIFDPYNPVIVNHYNQWLTTWGMAVIDEITLGGYFEANVWYDKYFNTVWSGEQISEYSGWSVGKIVSSEHYKSHNTTRYHQEFSDQMKIEYIYIGGSDKYDMTQFDQWAATVQNNLQVIKYHLQPISYLITNQTIRANVEKAIQFFTKQSVRDLQDYVTSLNF